LTGPGYDGGFFVAPTIIEGAGARRRDLAHRALRADHLPLSRAGASTRPVPIANDSPFGLTASVHTQSLHRAMTFLNPHPGRRWRW
jgi:aldehyde dehydrogenase (NAD+)